MDMAIIEGLVIFVAMLALLWGFYRWFIKVPATSEAEAKVRWQRMQEDVGAFEYDAEGFSYPFENGTSMIRWAEVDRIVGYKLDMFTVDEICIELHVGDRAIRFSESTAGWYQFQERLRNVFPDIRKDWELDVAMPAFETIYIVLYERRP